MNPILIGGIPAENNPMSNQAKQAGYIVNYCSRCRQQVLLGPKQMDMVRENPVAMVLCLPCAGGIGVEKKDVQFIGQPSKPSRWARLRGWLKQWRWG